MWESKNNILKETECIVHHPYYGNAIVLLTEDNAPLFLFYNIEGVLNNKYVILDAVPPYEITAKISTSSRTYQLTQYGAKEFANLDAGYYLDGGLLRIDGVYAQPYNYKFDDVVYGNQYWKGTIDIDWWNTDGGTQSFTLNEENGDSTATIRVINTAFGWWEQQDGSSGVFGVYVGKGAYEGEYRFIGTPTWQTADSKSIITTYYDLDEEEQVPKGLTLDEERDMYILGVYGSPNGWHEIPKGVFTFGDTITAIGCANEPKEGEEAPTPPANIDYSWQGFTDGNKDFSRVWVADTPSWR